MLVTNELDVCMHLIDRSLDQTSDLAEMSFHLRICLMLFGDAELLQKNWNLHLIEHGVAPSVDELQAERFRDRPVRRGQFR